MKKIPAFGLNTNKKLVAFLFAIVLAGGISYFVIFFPRLINSWVLSVSSLIFFVTLLFGWKLGSFLGTITWIFAIPLYPYNITYILLTFGFLFSQVGFSEYIRRLLINQEEEGKQKDICIAGIAHEIKTPLTALRIQVYMLQKTNPKLANTIAHEINRVLYLTERIVNFSKITTQHYRPTVEPLYLREVIIEVIEKLQLVYPEIIFREHLPKKVIPIVTDKYALEQIIMNLLTNAVKYGKKKPIDIYLKKKDSHLIVQVKDGGDGIPMMFQKKIFAPFTQYDTKSLGLGIGLYITKQLVDQCKGDISFTTNGKGTIFSVALPLKL